MQQGKIESFLPCNVRDERRVVDHRYTLSSKVRCVFFFFFATNLLETVLYLKKMLFRKSTLVTGESFCHRVEDWIAT